MRSLFQKETRNEFISRINKLQPDTKANWGKMNVSQMLLHSQQPFKVALDELKLKRGLMGILFGNIAKKKLTGPDPFQKNLPTDKNFIVKNTPDFITEKQNLISFIERFSNIETTSITKDPHPFFGKLTPEEWDILLYKHLDHHLRQFGS